MSFRTKTQCIINGSSFTAFSLFFLFLLYTDTEEEEEEMTAGDERRGSPVAFYGKVFEYALYIYSKCGITIENISLSSSWCH